MTAKLSVIRRCTALAALLIASTAWGAQVPDGACETWWPGFRAPGFDARVRALCVHRAQGAGAAALYAGGEFTLNSDSDSVGIARWNGTRWSNVGTGIPGNVLALSEHDDGSGAKLFAGGLFQAAGGSQAFSVACWDGVQWSPVGGGLSGSVHALCSFDDGTGPALYAGGEFTVPGDSTGARVARWNGSTWSVLGGGTDAIVWTLAAYDDGAGSKLYAAGSFSSAGSVVAQKIACWNGSTWQPLGSGLNASAYSLAAHAGQLWVSGDFGLADGVPVSFIARWNGTQFLAGGAFNRRVWRLASLDVGAGPVLFAAGDFDYQVKRFDGTNWLPLMTPPYFWSHDALAAYDSGSGLELCAARVRSPALEVARFTGTQWSALGTDRKRYASIQDLEAWRDPQTGRPALFATAKQDTSSHCLQSWDGNTWRSYFGVGNAYTDAIRSLSVARDAQGEALFIGGKFAQLGALAVQSIARFDGVNLTPMGGGLFVAYDDRGVLDVESFDAGFGPEVYAAGSFEMSSDSGVTHSVRYISRWNGAVWTALPNGPNACVLSLCEHDDGTDNRLYVAGEFHMLGGAPSNPVAAWDGTSWSSVGAPGTFPFGVAAKCLIEHDDGTGKALFALAANAAGEYRYLVRWTDPIWETVAGPIGTGISKPSSVVAWDDGSGGGARLYLSLDDSTPSESVLCWTGTGLEPVGGGVRNNLSLGLVKSLAILPSPAGGSDLYAGGYFYTAGSPPVESQHVARFVGCGPISSFCAGDGLDEHVTTPCPCANFGLPGHGCAWSNHPAGALLASSGARNPDSLVLNATGMPSSTGATVFWKGSALSPQGIPWGDGLRCIDGSLVRLGTKTNANGAASYPEAANAPISIRGGTPVGSGAVGYYQTTFRNAANYCTPATHNATNAVRVVW